MDRMPLQLGSLQPLSASNPRPAPTLGHRRRERPAKGPPGPALLVARRPTRGFTLLESLTVMAIAVITVTVGVPSYRGMIENQRASSAMHLLTAHIASARSTAITYRIPTVVCPSNRVGGCRLDGNWSEGWLMFFDPDGNRQPDSREDILRDENAPIHPSLRIVSSRGRPQLRYLPDGRSAGSNISVRLCREDLLLARVIVNNVGRVRSEKASGSTAC